MEAPPPSATTFPAPTGLQRGCCGKSWSQPVGQLLQEVEPVPEAYLPGAQGTQFTEPVLLVYVPCPQGVFGLFAPWQVEPRRQILVAWFESEYEPGGIALQPVEPESVLPHPNGQPLQLVRPGVDWNCPMSHE